METPKRARRGKPPTQPRGGAYPRPTALSDALERIRQAARRDKGLRFTSLWHHVYDVERLREAYFRLKRTSAPGTDGRTWRAYGEALEANLQDLSRRLARGAYRAKPVKRVYIPKADGGQRPIGVPVLEDKIVQRAAVEVLGAVYETDFKGFSYGFRPRRSAHDALDALAVAVDRKRVNWVLDADIRGFFDAIDHDWLVKFVEHRIADPRVVRHVKKWLHAGKTRLIEFGRHAAARRRRRGDGKPASFEFLGFTHVCGKTRQGRFALHRFTMRARLRRKRRELSQGLRDRRHTPVPEVGQWLRRVLQGHYRYYGVPGNSRLLGAFRHHVTRLWHRTLRRRSQRQRLTWERMTRLAARWLPRPRIVHPYPSVRVFARQ